MTNQELSDAEVRTLLARHLYRLFQQNADREAFNIVALADEIGVDVYRLDVEARLLKELGYASSIGYMYRVNPETMQRIDPVGEWDHVGGMTLTSLGLRWAASGFPPIRMEGSPEVHVNVDIHLAVSAVIQETRRAQNVDEETLLRFEAQLHRIEEELLKPAGRGRWEAVHDAVQTASASASLMGPLLPFLTSHWDKISQLVSIMPK